ncbi:MAG: hypothetical protein CTY38_01180 [Methylotenera sp.]|uniref:type I-F CRISPR-associated protein Csy2 n=1 Tax=Methylotenera sp. TaxID=2051956 RepID=UPI000D4D54E3|nr:type I-F CRISPR-associated protein Csy2 [Methylotenera sp.]PPC84689.1 MAG: hypothetical protein CTY38_01180 [Methylotenera sp.]
MPSQYLILKRMKVSHANANPAWWIVGPPAMSAYAGLVGSIEYNASKMSGDKVSSIAFAVVHHDIDLKGEIFGGKFSPNQFRGANLIDNTDYSSGSSGPTLAMQPTASCHLTASLIIKFEEDVGISKKAVEQLIQASKLRLAGGRINSVSVHIAKSLEEALSHFKTGFTVTDRKDLVEDYLASPKPHNEKTKTPEVDDVDVLDATLYYLHPSRQESLPWLSASTLGFARISETQQRLGSRDDHPHAFVEPVVGLIQYKPVREEGLSFWKWSHPHPNVSVLTN